jgi:hypothetical protein
LQGRLGRALMLDLAAMPAAGTPQESGLRIEGIVECSHGAPREF